MSGAYDLQIQTVYVAGGASMTTPRPMRLRALGLLTLLVSIAWLFAAWVPIWNWIGQELVFGGAALQGGVHASVLKPGAYSSQNSAADAAATAQAARQGQVTMLKLAGAWLGVVTLVGLWLAMSAVTALGVGRLGLPLGVVLALLALAAIVLLAWHVERRYDWAESLIPKWVLPSLITLGVVFAASIGATIRRRGLGMLRLAGVLVILSAAFSVGVIWAVLNYGNLPANPVSNVTYAQVFGLQSAYGWLLLLGSIGLK